MQKSRILLIIVIAAFVIAAFVAIIYNSMDLQAFTVESCITYNGRTGCGIAAGATREEALGSAATIACSGLSSGMTESIECSRTEPDSIRWIDE
jgi:hypothetical protein